ncbi:hypothetical protein HAX54_019200, partial [Datura stramonium]|nr:hypothetical protein [Datura stramonium]
GGELQEETKIGLVGSRPAKREHLHEPQLYPKLAQEAMSLLGNIGRSPFTSTIVGHYFTPVIHWRFAKLHPPFADGSPNGDIMSLSRRRDPSMQKLNLRWNLSRMRS